MLLFVCGDVMTGRGIDQILPFPGDPRIYEPLLTSAADYVRLAEQATGPIPSPVPFAYPWGDALAEMERLSPDVRIINLETSVTASREQWPGKGINYKMHPANVPCLTAAGIDCCTLANNHVLDWGYTGLFETIDTLDRAGIRHAGAGRDLREAQVPAIITAAHDHRVVMLSAGSPTSGVLTAWAATATRAGVLYFDESSEESVQAIAGMLASVKRQGDIAVVSLHWGGNWGYAISEEQQQFAHRLIEEAGADLIHGHSSHHVKGLEVYHGKLILYGCGNLLDDYEGIGNYDAFRPDMTLLYFVTIDETNGLLRELCMVPMQIRHFRLNRVEREDANWLCETLSREGAVFGNAVQLHEDNTLTLVWL